MIPARPFRVVVALVLLGLLWRSSALADPPPPSPTDPVAAEALFNEGRDALQAGNVETACNLFAESYRLDPAVGTVLNLANCEERLGRLAAAWEHFRRALDLLPARDPRVRVARARVTALEARLPRMIITVAVPLPAGATVTRDGVLLGDATLGVPIPVDPGPHTIVVRARGRADETYRVRVEEAETRSVAIAAGDIAGAGEATGAGPDRGVSPPHGATAPARPLRSVAIVALSVGAAALILGSVTGALAMGRAAVVDDPAHCDADLRCDQEGVDAADAGGTLATVSTIGFVTGGAAVAAGVVLWLLPGHPPEVQAGPTALRVRPLLGSAPGLQADLTF